MVYSIGLNKGRNILAAEKFIDELWSFQTISILVDNYP